VNAAIDETVRRDGQPAIELLAPLSRLGATRLSKTAAEM
jgi:hypothetical protein